MDMRRLSQYLVLSLIVAIALQVSCGGGSLLKMFRVALASSGPLVNSLVATGAIPQGKATAIIADFDAGAACGLTLQNEFSVAITRAEKLAASQRALTCFRAIINRQNFAAHPRIQQAANIAEGILNSLVIFYSDTGDVRSSADLKRSGRNTAGDEKDLENQLKEQVKALKEALKP